MLSIVVLAGGLANRLRPITETLPKSLFPIHGLPFVLHQLHLFNKKGITHVHFCLGYLGQLVVNLIDRSSYKSAMNITYSFDGEKLLGTGGAIKNALSYLPEFFFVTYGDSYLDADFKEIQDVFFSVNTGNEGLITIYKNNNKYDVSNVVFKDNKIKTYSKKQLTAEMEYIDYGLGILQKKHFLCPDYDTSFDLAQIYEKLSYEGKLIGFEMQQRFYEIGSFQGIDELSNFLNKKKL
ncbi:MAG: sugar phosphate nucleotidyltransferase [Bacteroidia bacterium]|nr:sugar phosphate nucleotidyltransferase [Bacteroidia bacterium]